MKNKTKYEIVKSEGCLSFGTTVNGQNMYGEFEPMTVEQIDTFVDYLCEKFKQELKDNTVSIDDLLNCFQYDECETEDGYCETCGDSVTTTTWNL
jgi:hypothetical protein